MKELAAEVRRKLGDTDRWLSECAAIKEENSKTRADLEAQGKKLSELEGRFSAFKV
jgi:hypothetical protein